MARQSIAKRKPEPQPMPGTEAAAQSPMIRANQAKPDSDDLEESHDKARTRREIAEANLAELREGELSRELVRRADIEKASYEAARALRDGLSNCAKRLGATVAVLTTPEECAAAIEREHRTLLQSWSRTMGSLSEQAAP
jgi:hypothetical protein